MPTKNIGGLWKTKKKTEKSPALTGVIEIIAGFPQRVAIFQNSKKTEGSKQPDYNIVLSEPFEKQEEKPDEIKPEEL